MDEKAASGTKLQVLNRDMIKYTAMFTMLLNHIAHALLPYGTLLYEVLEDIGYFTAPVMCYFMVEGYGYTRSRLRYGLRLLAFAAISQIPYSLVFHYGNLNMIYTLLCCFLILTVMEQVQFPIYRTMLCFLLVLVTGVGDWAFLAPIYTILFYNSRGDRKRTAYSFGSAYVLFALFNLLIQIMEAGSLTFIGIVHALLAGVGIIVAGTVVLVFYSGKRAEKGRNFSKWFFYIFYPAHLLMLYFVKIYTGAAVGM